MKRPVFTGAAVAIITPMNTDGSVNYDELGRIIDDQIAHSTDAIVICGTTGESPTLTDEEHTECIRYTVKKVAGRVPVIAGTGSNDTKYAIWLSQQAEADGADALLLVTPYYNKTTRRPAGPLHSHCGRRAYPLHPVQCAQPHGLQPDARHAGRACEAPEHQRRQGGQPATSATWPRSRRPAVTA